MPALEELEDWLISNHGNTVDRDRLSVVRQELERVAHDGIAGAVVEAGCYKGAMSVWMRAVLDSVKDHERRIVVFDSFAGMPESGAFDSGYFDSGSLRASIGDVRLLHEKWRLAPPEIHSGWFIDTLHAGLPEQVAFAYLDSDLYESMLCSLRNVEPRLAPGGVLIIDDYADTSVNQAAWNGAPGVARACWDYFGGKSRIEALEGAQDLALGRIRGV